MPTKGEGNPVAGEKEESNGGERRALITNPADTSKPPRKRKKKIGSVLGEKKKWKRGPAHADSVKGAGKKLEERGVQTLHKGYRTEKGKKAGAAHPGGGEKAWLVPSGEEAAAADFPGRGRCDFPRQKNLRAPKGSCHWRKDPCNLLSDASQPRVLKESCKARERQEGRITHAGQQGVRQ